MSNRNRVAHVTGFNLSAADAVGGPGSFFVADGNPGALAGPLEGFSVAFGIKSRVLASSGGNPTPWISDFSSIADFPTVEWIAGNWQNDLGWGININPDGFFFQIGDASLQLSTLVPDLRGDMIALASFIADDAPYGGAGVNQVRIALNGVLGVDATNTFVYGQSPLAFALGGTLDPTELALSPAVGGMYNSLLSSLWITPGVPTIQQANDFFETSIQAGRVVPQAWAPPLAQLGGSLVTPDDPTGAFFLAGDADLEAGLDGTWVDRISSITLTRAGNPGTTPAAGDARFVARQPWYSL